MLKIDVHGIPGSSEYGAAITLKSIIDSAKRDGDKGNILLRAPTKLYGQKKRDIDLLFIGRFKHGLRRSVRLPKSSDVEEVAFFNIVATIEVKDHTSDRVRFHGSEAQVKYRSGWSSATDQSEQQKESARSYIKNQLNWEPFVCNLIWFRNLVRDDLPPSVNNFLAADLTLEDLLEKFCLMAPECIYPRSGSSKRFYATKVVHAEELMAREDQIFSIWREHRAATGVLTRSKLEKLTTAILKDQMYAQSIGQRLVLIRGRAGTGKTLKLLRIAYDLCTNKGQRVLILTYNRMLVSDLSRLVTLAGLSSDLDTSTVEIDTIHRYVRRLLKHFDIAFDPDHFISNYEHLKAALLLHLSRDLLNQSEISYSQPKSDDETSWDTVLIDEGQDWPNDEKQILFHLFSPQNMVVAFGTGQSVRSIRVADWTSGIDCNKPPLEKVSLRQKRNICEFERLYAERFRVDWGLEPKDDLIGGRVVIVKGTYTKQLHDRLFSKCQQDGNSAYEYLFLVPPSLTLSAGQGQRKFALTEQFVDWGINIWDGVTRTNRTEYPTGVDEHRVIPYESARGLEGWVVVCMALDEFVTYKKVNPYIVGGKSVDLQLRLGLQSPEEKILELVHEWVLIALTRAIDTIVITLSNSSSPFAAALLEIAEKCQDFVEIVDDGNPLGGQHRVDGPSPGVSVAALTPVAEMIRRYDRVPRERRDTSIDATSKHKDDALNASSPIELQKPVPFQIAFDSVPPWLIRFVFEQMSLSRLEFEVRISPGGSLLDCRYRDDWPGDWPDTIASLASSGFLEIAGNAQDPRMVGQTSKLKDTGSVLYRFAERGVQQTKQWLGEYKRTRESASKVAK